MENDAACILDEVFPFAVNRGLSHPLPPGDLYALPALCPRGHTSSTK
jgi:hypothetical protein